MTRPDPYNHKLTNIDYSNHLKSIKKSASSLSKCHPSASSWTRHLATARASLVQDTNTSTGLLALPVAIHGIVSMGGPRAAVARLSQVAAIEMACDRDLAMLNPSHLSPWGCLVHEAVPGAKHFKCAAVGQQVPISEQTWVTYGNMFTAKRFCSKPVVSEGWRKVSAIPSVRSDS